MPQDTPTNAVSSCPPPTCSASSSRLFPGAGIPPEILSVHGRAWLLTRGRTSISGIKAFDITQEFPDITPFIARAFGFQPSAEAVTLPALNLARFAFGKLSLCLTLTALDDGRMVSVTNSQEPDFFRLDHGYASDSRRSPRLAHARVRPPDVGHGRAGRTRRAGRSDRRHAAGTGTAPRHHPGRRRGRPRYVRHRTAGRTAGTPRVARSPQAPPCCSPCFPPSRP